MEEVYWVIKLLWWKILPFFYRHENKTIGVLIADCGLKQLYFRKKMIMYNIISKMNSTFGTIGKATTDKLTEMVDGKNSSFRIN